MLFDEGGLSQSCFHFHVGWNACAMKSICVGVRLYSDVLSMGYLAYNRR